MYILKNSLISIFRNKGRNILIGLIILTIACASTVTLAIRNTANNIVENYEVGDKIAPIRELANILNVSPNTIRRALLDLFQGGNLVSQRGKLGGIFIMEMPEVEGDSYRWLALNPDAISFKN